ncbi:hypothetical protein [Arthrobacter sp. MA-N2]|nr:hypothetical protein [Arthrobacter sp. MA-N2]
MPVLPEITALSDYLGDRRSGAKRVATKSSARRSYLSVAVGFLVFA